MITMDTQRAQDVSLLDLITVQDDEGNTFTGKTVGITLVGASYQGAVALTILLPNQHVMTFYHLPHDMIPYQAR